MTLPDGGTKIRETEREGIEIGIFLVTLSVFPLRPIIPAPSISRPLPRLLSFLPPTASPRSLNGGWGRGERGTSLPLPPHFPTPSPPCHLPSLPHQGNEIKASASSFIPSTSSTLSLTSNHLHEFTVILDTKSIRFYNTNSRV